jgi:1-acyl-sn-glycerol-3-phosphate acyltransferase
VRDDPGHRARIPGLRDLARTVLTLGAILPGLGAGLATLAWSRDRRRALNRAIALWGDLGTAAAGIRLEVEGAHHLEETRPAVFILNHQSGVDPILVCALLRRDFVGVAKQEIRRNPLLGPAFAFAGTVFLDRFDRNAALRALQPAIDTLHGGTSVAVAPEGTRSPGSRIGSFKKGAFRLALAAKVPVVPIVIHNAADVLPRRGWLMTAATVRVTVHAPVPTQAWNRVDLDERIAEIETLYREVLASEDR